MRLLQLHSDFVEYEPIEKEINEAENLSSNGKQRIEDVVLNLITVENGDDEEVVSAAIEEMHRYLDRVKSKKVLIYPYSHLSSNLASPKIAFELLKSLESSARKSFEVYRAPFGWTKSFNVKVKGHPLAENFRVLSKGESPLNVLKSNAQISEDNISQALKAEERLTSSWFIMRPNGDTVPLGDYRFNKEEVNLKVLANYETLKKRTVDEVPPHVKLMKKMSIADYEPASDAGNMRFYPKGRLMKSLIERYVTDRVIAYGGIEIETPIMYDSKHPSMESYFNRFPARQYSILSDNNRKLILRFAACFGQFLMAKDFQLSYKHMPLRLYELSRYSFRREKSGELVGLRRLRAFSMPDCHALCKDMNQAKEEFLNRIDLSMDVINGLGLSITEDLEMALRFTEGFYQENKDFVREIVTKFGKPVLIEMWRDRFFYFTLKWEFNFVDNLDKASALSTDQIDVENGERYDIKFVDEDGSIKYPIILHNSPSGAVERIIYALLEKAAKSSRMGNKPNLPLWLIHTQVRIIPVAKQHMPYCEKMLDYLSNMQIRADLDDREESVSKKIRESETEWIRYTLVVGDKEMQEEKLIVRDRVLGKQRVIILKDLVEEIRTQIADKPHQRLNLPSHLSKRPQIMV
ncbi:MAG TPA: threonine--tRNA ligase [Nitrososphaeraceae archaeon]|jgi:threonyl-tRNA synthetase